MGIAHLTRLARIADDAFGDELTRLYGRQACNARYDARGKATPELRRLANDKRAADYAVHCAYCETWNATPSALVLVDANGRDSLCHA